MKSAWHLLGTQIWMLQQLQRDLADMSKKLDQMSRRHTHDVICVNSYRSVARKVIQRQRMLDLISADRFDLHEEENQ